MSNLDAQDDSQSRQSTESRKDSASAPQFASYPQLSGRESSLDDPPESPGVPKLPEPKLDITLDFDGIISESDIDPETKEKVQKRASNVMKLAEENEKLEAELRAMTERLEAAEQKRAALLAKTGEGDQGTTTAS